jgi:hypothetical protein
MGHVDDAHDAEGDGEADGGQQQHRTEGQAIPDVLPGFPQGKPALDRLRAGESGRAYGIVGPFRHGLQQLEGIPVATGLNDDDGGQLVFRGCIAAQQGGRPRLTHERLHAVVGLHRERPIESGDRVGIAALEHGIGRFPSDIAVGAHQRERTQCRFDGAAQPIVDLDAFDLAGTGDAGCGVGNRIDQRETSASLACDEDGAVVLPDIETAGVERLQDGGHVAVSGCGQRRDGLLAIAEAALAESVD